VIAIPAAIVVDVADQLLATGTAHHAYIGIRPATLTPEIARLLGINRTTLYSRMGTKEEK